MFGMLLWSYAVRHRMDLAPSGGNVMTIFS